MSANTWATWIARWKDGEKERDGEEGGECDRKGRKGRTKKGVLKKVGVDESVMCRTGSSRSAPAWG